MVQKASIVCYYFLLDNLLIFYEFCLKKHDGEPYPFSVLDVITVLLICVLSLMYCYHYNLFPFQ